MTTEALRSAAAPAPPRWYTPEPWFNFFDIWSATSAS
jgi:hypothetical protein